jgi:hypothetical protein
MDWGTCNLGCGTYNMSWGTSYRSRETQNSASIGIPELNSWPGRTLAKLARE